MAAKFLRMHRAYVYKPEIRKTRMSVPELVGQPAFYDIFGFLGFVVIVHIALYWLRRSQPPPKWVAIVLLVIGVIGGVVDAIIVYKQFLS